MVLLDDDIYKETKEIVRGKRRQSPLVMELAEWFRIKYSVKVLNIQFSKLTGPQENRFRLYVIIENTNDYQKMYVSPSQPNEEYQAQIALEFRKLALKHKFTDESSLENLFVIYNDFSDEAKTEANWGAAKEVTAQIKSKYPIVWDVISMFSGSVVFYNTDTDIGVNENNGLSKAIRDTYYSILKRYDEFNYFTRENISLRFDSKENLDKNYQGNLFYYTR
jgi:hypothetical protein